MRLYPATIIRLGISQASPLHTSSSSAIPSFHHLTSFTSAAQHRNSKNGTTMAWFSTMTLLAGTHLITMVITRSSRWAATLTHVADQQIDAGVAADQQQHVGASAHQGGGAHAQQAGRAASWRRRASSNSLGVCSSGALTLSWTSFAICRDPLVNVR